MNELADKIQDYREALKIINVFNEKTQRIKLLIEMSLEIGLGNHENQNQFFSFLQSNVFIGSIIIDLFAIFDNSKRSSLKRLGKISKKFEHVIPNEMIDGWIKSLERYETFRHSIFAHASIYRLDRHPFDYGYLLDLVSCFESKIKEIDDECKSKILKHDKIVLWAKNEVEPNCDVLRDLRGVFDLLQSDSAKGVSYAE